jgi:hypothetical protein
MLCIPLLYSKLATVNGEYVYDESSQRHRVYLISKIMTNHAWTVKVSYVITEECD